MIQSEDTVLVLGGARVPPASRGRQDSSLGWGWGVLSPSHLPSLSGDLPL